MRVEHVDDLGEVGERAGEAVDLVDDDDLNLAGLDVRQQPLQGRALHRAAGKPPSSYMSGSAIQPAWRWLTM